MKIKRFFGSDMRSVIQEVRESQGPDAVILSNRRVDGGVEVITAIDYDEALVHEAVDRSMSASQRANEAAQPRGAIETYEAAAARESGQQGEEDTDIEEVFGEQDDEHDLAGLTPPSSEKRPQIVWSQDPAMMAMREELSAVRELLEQQLTRLGWNDMVRRDPALGAAFQKLLSLGISESLARDLVSSLSGALDKENARRMALAALARRLPIAGDEILSNGGVIALVGTTGVGKTTTLAKLAAHYALQHGPNSVALISTDNYRIGAHDQLLTYGRILGVPVRLVEDGPQLLRTLASLSDRSLVLIDSVGLCQRKVQTADQLSWLRTVGDAVKPYLVLPATAQAEAVRATVEAFRCVALAGCIVTKLDEAASLGPALSELARGGLPVAYTTDGQRVPEDIEVARAHALVARAAKLARQQAADQPDAVFVQAGGRDHG
ncbi:MAG: flagellar biosynthesis protein FlhF [Pseudomonadota bacterium]|nr:flagellar biosynthesis protein FlhF [Pseudomonadota bacterium]